MRKKQFYKLVLGIAAIVIGIYMNFFYKSDEADEKTVTGYEKETGESEKSKSEESEATVMPDNHDYMEMELPESDNIAENEVYSDGYISDIYFSNTKKLDEGKMPLKAQARLVTDADRILKRSGYEDVTELYIDDESYRETDEYISFRCFMDGYTDQLEIKYSIGEKTLNYNIIVQDGSMD